MTQGNNTNFRIAEIVFLCALIVFAFFNCFRFGSLIARDHLAALLGVPFLLALIIYSLIIIFSKSAKIRRIFRIINYTYIATMTLYITTIMSIKHKQGKNAFNYLYSFDPPGSSRAEKIFNNYAISGLIICIVLLIVNYIKLYRRGAE